MPRNGHWRTISDGNVRIADRANLKYHIFGHPRFLLRGLRGAQTEISLAVAAYNLKRMLNILGGRKLHVALQAI
jgi:hypothetical protein